MKLSKKFLNDYIDISNISYNELAEKMVLVGNEYEEIKKQVEATCLVVGQVIECQNHLDSKKLHICKVNIGDEIKQIVCGAPNVREGIKVIVAKIGAKLPGGIVIKEAKLAGFDSCGMLCSIAELGIDEKYLTEEDKNGIHILDDSAIVGDDALKALNLDDEIIDFELTANRADLLSVIGFAYEVGAVYNCDVKMPATIFKEEKIDDKLKLEVKTPNCSLYLGRKVVNVKIKPSPDFIKNRLMASGIRSINNVVDISNYVMLEYGQPLHFFDADKLGNKIIVRQALAKEALTTLDNIERTLNEDDIVIANDEKIVALAGVMGGLETEVEETTKNIFIESAIFDSYSIRKTAKNILRSEASNRFEKGLDPNRTKLALDRACHLLEKYADATITNATVSFDKTNKEAKKINISLEKINSVLGLDLKLEQVIDIFKRLKFEVNVKDNLEVIVPTRRLDVNIKEDLIEEVGRIHGYDGLKGKQPVLEIRKGSRSLKQTMIYELRNRLSSLGLNQVLTYSLVNKDVVDNFTIENLETISLLSPMSENNSVLRKSLISSLIEVFNYNIARNIKDIFIYEVGSRYYKINEGYFEETLVSGLIYGNYINNNFLKINLKTDFYLLKGIVENILDYLGFKDRYVFKKDEINSMHPKRGAQIILDNEVIGFLGQIHPQINKKEIYVFEINVDKLLTKKVRAIKYKEICKYPSVNKDVAFILDNNITSEEIIKVIKKAGGKLLTNVEVFDVYRGENIDSNKKSIAFSLTFQDVTKTLSDEEVNTLFSNIITRVTDLGGILRNK